MSQQNTPYVLTKLARMDAIAEESPLTAELLGEFGLHCVGCYIGRSETVVAAGLLHGMTEEEVDEMVYEINMELVKEKRESNVIARSKTTNRQGRVSPTAEQSST